MFGRVSRQVWLDHTDENICARLQTGKMWKLWMEELRLMAAGLSTASIYTKTDKGLATEFLKNNYEVDAATGTRYDPDDPPQSLDVDKINVRAFRKQVGAVLNQPGNDAVQVVLRYVHLLHPSHPSYLDMQCIHLIHPIHPISTRSLVASLSGVRWPDMMAALEVIGDPQEVGANVWVENVCRMVLATVEKKRGEKNTFDYGQTQKVQGDYIFTLLVPHAVHVYTQQKGNYPSRPRKATKKVADVRKFKEANPWCEDKAILIREALDNYKWGGKDGGRPPLILDRDDLAAKAGEEEEDVGVDDEQPEEPEKNKRHRQA